MPNEYIMHQLKKGYQAGIDLSDYVTYGISTMREMRLAEMEDVDITGYAEAGYDAEQLRAIRRALVNHLDIEPYLSTEYQGDAIMEIVIGLEHHVDVSKYAKDCYSWRKMREIRLGLENHVDVSYYANPRYSYWQMREIRLGLQEELDVDSYCNLMYTAKTMKRKRMELLAEKRRKATAYIKHEFKYGNLYISQDEMRAEIEILDAQWKPDSIAIRELLVSGGIVTGYDELAIIRVESGVNVLGERIEIARGENSIPGQDGYYTFNFCNKRSYMPTDESDGTSDFEKIRCVERVLKGQTLATYYPATKGTPGRTVTGRILYAPDGKEIPQLWGENISLLEDGRTYVSQINGRVILHERNLYVEELTIIDDNIWEEHTLDFPGTVHITVDVPEGVQIHAKGDIIVDGMVTGAVLDADRNILVRLGINKGTTGAKLTAKENVTVKYSEYAQIKAGKNIYLNYSLNSVLLAKEAIITFGQRGGIIGGTAFAERGFCISNLGNETGRDTQIGFGAWEELKKRLIKVENDIRTANKEFEELQELLKKIVDKSNGIQDQNSEIIMKLGNNIHHTMKNIAYYEAERERLEQRINKAMKAQVIVNHKIYDNVTFICDKEKYSPHRLQHVSVRYLSGAFEVNNLAI